MPEFTQNSSRQASLPDVEPGILRGGPKAVGCGGARGGGQYLDHYRAILDYIRA